MKKAKPYIIIAVILVAIIALFYGLIYISFIQIEVASQPNPNQDSLVRSVQFGHANIFFIKADTGYIMVDAGAYGSSDNFDEVLALVNIDPEEIKLIIITHGHSDHVGMLAYAQEVTGAEILAHESLADVLPEGNYVDPVAQTGFGKFLNVVTVVYTAFGGGKLQGINPDILVGDQFDLNEYGVNGQITYTPGHSLGSLTILLENGEALIGDMVRTEESGDLSLGMFYDDLDALKNSLEKTIDLEPGVIYLSHGNFVELDELEQFYSGALAD